MVIGFIIGQLMIVFINQDGFVEMYVLFFCKIQDYLVIYNGW